MSKFTNRTPRKQTDGQSRGAVAPTPQALAMSDQLNPSYVGVHGGTYDSQPKYMTDNMARPSYVAAMIANMAPSEIPVHSFTAWPSGMYTYQMVESVALPTGQIVPITYMGDYGSMVTKARVS